MSKLATKETTVTSLNDQSQTAATLMICGECGCQTFFLYMVGAARQHQHVQCTQCGESYCDGKCAVAGKEN